MSIEPRSKLADRLVESLTAMVFFGLIGPPVGGLVSLATINPLWSASHLPYYPVTPWEMVSNVLLLIPVMLFIFIMSYFYGGAAAGLTGLIVGYFADRIVGARRNILTAMLMGGFLGAVTSTVVMSAMDPWGGNTPSFHILEMTTMGWLHRLRDHQWTYGQLLEVAPVTLYPGFGGGLIATLLYRRNFRQRAEKQIDPAGG